MNRSQVKRPEAIEVKCFGANRCRTPEQLAHEEMRRDALHPWRTRCRKVGAHLMGWATIFAMFAGSSLLVEWWDSLPN